METYAVGEKNPQKYTCNCCDYNTCNKKDYKKHLQTIKHEKLSNSGKYLHNTYKNPNVLYNCECGKTYNHRQSLWAHKKKGCLGKVENNEENIIVQCPAVINSESKSKNEDIPTKMEEPSSNTEDELKELKSMFIKMIEINQDLQKQIVEICKEGKITNNTTNNNTTNNKFNLNVFLNEKCKDALNLTDFISNLNVGFSDFENFGKIGYSNSISHIFIRGLKELDIYKRPIHCSDLKREIIHIKDDNTWKKDDEKEQMIKAIKIIEHKNIKQIPDWIKAHPTHTDIRSKKFDEYSKMLDQSMGEYEDEDNQKNYQKIIRAVAKEILVDK